MKKTIITIIQIFAAFVALAISVAVLRRHVVQILSKPPDITDEADAYRDAAVFSALDLDDAFGYKVSLPNGDWVKMVVIPKPRPRQDVELSAPGTFYATASDGRRVKKNCDEYYSEFDMTVLALDTDNPNAVVDDILHHPRLRRDFSINMMDNFDDFRWQPDFKEPEIYRGEE